MARNLFLIAVAMSLLMLGAPAMADWNFAAEFPVGTNPIGAWTLGYLDATGATFVPYNTFANDGTNDTWTYNGDVESYGIPFKNSHDPSINWEPVGLAGMHPANSTNLSTGRWTAPSAMLARIAGSFQAWRGGDQDVHIFHNGTEIFSDVVAGVYDPANPAAGTYKAFDLYVNVASGDTVDFGVGYGPNHFYGSGHTGVDATISESTMGVISGTVTVNTTDHPAASGVTVTDQSSGTSVITDLSGFYTLAATPGTHTVTFARAGLVAETVTGVTVTAGNVTTIPTVDMDIRTGIIYYVNDATGNDSNNGTSPATAWKTIQRGELDGTILPGDTVKVAEGTYPQTSWEGVKITRGGDSFQRVTYMKDETATGDVLIDMASAPADSRNLKTGIQVYANYVNIDGFKIANACWGILLDGYGSIDLANCEIHGMRPAKPNDPRGPLHPDGFMGTSFGILNAGCANVVNRNNLVYDIGDPTTPNLASCIASPGCVNVDIYNNTLLDAQSGIASWAGVDQIEFKNNIVANMRGFGIDSSYGWVDGAGLLTRTNNFYFNNIGGDYGWAGAVAGEGEYNCNPRLNSMYRLDTGSPAANMGVDVGLPFTAPAPDLGAFESTQMTQTNSFVQGTVTSTLTGNPPVTRATISDGGVALGATNTQGEYLFPIVAGTYSMTCTRGGFASQTANVTTTAGNTTTKDWSLAKVAGSTWYVNASSGSDSNSGQSAGAAWATINRGDVLGAVKPGDTVMVADGQYPQANYLGARLSKCFGEVGAPITYKADGNAAINQDSTKGDDLSSVGFDVDVDNTIIDGFDVSFSQYGVYVRGARSGITVANNYLHDLTEPAPGDGGTQGRSAGIFVESASKIDVHNNMILNVGEQSTMSATNSAVMLFGCSDVKVNNNTMVRCGSGVYGSDSGANHEIHNNIMTQMWAAALSYSFAPETINHTHNLFYNDENGGADYGGTMTPGRIEFNTNPLFDDLSLPYGFCLQSTSPAINMGVDVGLDYIGPAPDLGAYETTITTMPTHYGFITGTIKLRSDHSPVVGAKVQADGQTMWEATDAAGTYLLMLTPGTYTIQASKPGYGIQTANVTVAGGTTATQDFWFTPGAFGTWNYAADFSTGPQPNGPWTYGYLDEAAAFTLYNTPGQDSYNITWTYDGDEATYGIPFKNYRDPSNNWEPVGFAGIHPSNTANLAAGRWTAPANMTVQVYGSFQAWAGGGQDVHVFVNGEQRFGSDVAGVYPALGSTASFDLVLDVVANDTIDFSVGRGSDGWYGGGHTGIDATIAGPDSSVATPATLAEAKTYGDGKLVSFTTDQVVTAASGTFANGSCYIEDPERTSGIKVVFNSGIPAVALGDRIQFDGTMGTDANGERFIQITSVTSKTAGTALVSLGMTNKTFDAGKIGILVKVWGKVVEKATIDGVTYVIVDDGSGLTAKAILSGTQVTTNVTVGKYMTVTGIAGRTDDDVTIETVVRPRNNADIVLYDIP